MPAAGRQLARAELSVLPRGCAMTESIWMGARLLLLIAIANNAPLGAKLVLGSRWSAPIDGGRQWWDRRPVLGPSKTWRGLLAAIILSAIVAPLLGLPVEAGASIGALAMLGDALASFAKRRVGIPSSGRAFGLDQVPESLLPLVVVQPWLALPWTAVAGVAIAFLLLETPGARLAHRVGWRDTPH